MRLEILDSMGDGPDNHVYSQNLVELPNQDQAIDEVLALIRKNCNVFITGSGGTGKSFLISQVVVKRRDEKKECCVTASTGMAARLIGGETLHAWAGIGLGLGTFDSILPRVMKNQRTQNRILATEVLIIDEISMINSSLFLVLDKICRHVRKKEKQPFGGLI